MEEGEFSEAREDLAALEVFAVSSTFIEICDVLLTVIEMEVINSCQDRNGGCAHLCTYTSAGIICSCFSGYLLDRDGRGCVGKCRQLQLLLKLVCMVRPVLIYMYLLLSRLDG